TQIRAYEVQFVPGLFQTGDYARAVTLLGHDGEPARDIERRVRLGRARQPRLGRGGRPDVRARLDTAVLSVPDATTAALPPRPTAPRSSRESSPAADHRARTGSAVPSAAAGAAKAP